MNVLIIDDEPSDIEAMRIAMQAGGFSPILTADSYDSSLRIFDKHLGRIDLALVDISLPKKNGVELARELLRRNPELKILFVSGHVGAEVIRFYGLRATDLHFLKKPFTAADLLSRAESARFRRAPTTGRFRWRPAAGSVRKRGVGAVSDQRSAISFPAHVRQLCHRPAKPPPPDAVLS